MVRIKQFFKNFLSRSWYCLMLPGKKKRKKKKRKKKVDKFSCGQAQALTFFHEFQYILIFLSHYARTFQMSNCGLQLNIPYPVSSALAIGQSKTNYLGSICWCLWEEFRIVIVSEITLIFFFLNVLWVAGIFVILSENMLPYLPLLAQHSAIP